MPKIQESAKKYIQSVSLNESNFWEIIENNIFESPLFDSKIKSFIMEKATTILKSEKFLNMPETIVNTIIEMDKLNVNENELLLAVTRWGLKNVASPTSFTLKKFYKHIRFSTLTSNQFFSFLENYRNAIDAESSLRILQHLHCPSRHNLHEWCCPSKVSRMKDFQPKVQYGNRGYNYGNW